MPPSNLKSKASTKYPLENIHQAGVYQYYISSPAYGGTLLMPKIVAELVGSNRNKKLSYWDTSGILTKDISALHALIEAQGGKCVLQKETSDFVYAWEGSYSIISFDKKDSSITLSCIGLDPKLIEFFKSIEAEYISKVKKNLIFSIIKTATGLDIKSLGNGHSPLIEGNYLPKVLEDMQYVITTFQKDPPPGRIAILNGEPGTGKTHLIRSMLSQLDCVFLIIPSNLIDSLDKPDFLPLLIAVKEKHEKPIVMIIEDGDTCLVPRRGDNISTIASLLNISDGIIGSLIDIRVVISTNAYIDQVDRAILRPGRLCKQIHVGPLPFEQANKVYQRLMNDPALSLEHSKEYTLAEIYDRFNTRDSEPAAHHNFGSKRPIGFNANHSNNTDRTLNKSESRVVGFRADLTEKK